MKKLGAISFLALMLVAKPGAVCANEADAKLLGKALSEAYGAEVQVELNADKCEVRYPQVKVEKETPQFIAPQNPGEPPRMETKKEISYISETTASCRKIEDFDGMSQYQVTGVSADKFLAQIYNFIGLSFLKDIQIKNFSEETSVVPQIGLISADKVSMDDAIYVTTDETTGLKSELGGLKKLSVDRKVVKDGEKVVYSYDTTLDTLNFALPFFAMQIKSGKHTAELEYKVSADVVFDYSKPTQGIENMVFSKSQASDKGIKINVDFFDFGLSFDSDIKNYTKLNSSNSFDTMGEMALSSISFNGSMIDEVLGTAKQLKKASLKYALNQIDTASFNKLSKIQQEKQSGKEPDDREMAKVLDGIAEKAELLLSLNLEFSNAGISAKVSGKKKNGYLDGAGKIEVKNLYNIFPEQKQCLNNPNAANIPACADGSLFSDLKKYIDVSKDNSVTIIKFNDKGVFRDNKKIGEPLELNFQKMQMEKEIKDKEREEQIKKMMEQRAANPQP